MTDIDHEAAERIARDIGKTYQWPGDAAVRLVFAAYLDALEQTERSRKGAKCIYCRAPATHVCRADIHRYDASPTWLCDKCSCPVLP